MFIDENVLSFIAYNPDNKAALALDSCYDLFKQMPIPMNLALLIGAAKEMELVSGGKVRFLTCLHKDGYYEWL